MSKPCVTLFGSSLCQPGDDLWALAEETGEALVRAGFRLCNGGYGGTMEASACGARRAGGHTIGVGVSIFHRTPNPSLDEFQLKSTLYERLEELLAQGDAFLVFPGGTGTLLELALAWELGGKRLSRPKPIVLLGDHWVPVVECVLKTPEAPAVTESIPSGPHPPAQWPAFLHVVQTPQRAADLLAILLV